MAQRPADGDFWAFQMNSGVGFLRVRSAADAVCAVYGRTFPSADISLDQVAESPVAFNVMCELSAFGDTFQRVGNQPLPTELRDPVWFWRRIVGNAELVTLVSSHGEEKKAPIHCAEGLERTGGYGPDEIAARLGAWLRGSDPTLEENRRRLREKPWL